MNTLQKVVDRISTIAAATAGLLLVSIVVLILLEVILRTLFSSSTYVLDEFVGYGVAAVTFLSLGNTLENNALIRVNIILYKVSSGIRRLLEVIAATTTLIIVSLFGWFIFIRAISHWNRGVVSSSIAETPLWVPQALILAGLMVFWLQLVSYLLRMAFSTEQAGLQYAAPPNVPNDKPTDKAQT